jgi:hypothetical protein
LSVRAKCDRKSSEDDVEGEREHMWVWPGDISMDGKDNKEYSVAARERLPSNIGCGREERGKKDNTKGRGGERGSWQAVVSRNDRNELTRVAICRSATRKMGGEKFE